MLAGEHHDLGFCGADGAPVNPEYVSKAFLRRARGAGVAPIRFHDLRHTCATLLLGKGVHPKFVQELLGHATIAITLDTYSHVLPGMGKQTADAMEAVLQES